MYLDHAERPVKDLPVSPSERRLKNFVEREGSAEGRTRERDRDRAPESFREREATMKALL